MDNIKNAIGQKKRAPSAYAKFVKAHYAATRVTHKRSQDRIRHIASLWRMRNATPKAALQTQNKNR